MNVTYQSCAHIKARFFRADDRHIEQGYVESVTEDGDFEFGFELRLVETGESRSGVGRLKMCCRQIPECINQTSY